MKSSSNQNDGIAALEDLTAIALSPYGPNESDEIVELEERIRQALTGYRVPEQWEMTMKRIAYMGSDCPPAIDPGGFYRLQLYNCITLAATALDAIPDLKE